MAYRIHHLNCATLCPGTRRLLNGERSLTGLLKKGLMVCHCLLIETDHGLVLVDTGYSQQELGAPNLQERLALTSLSVQLRPQDSAVAQVRALGFRPQDVTDIVLTHLDVDHGGGIRDFPHARIHLHERELVAAANPRTLREKYRYPPRIIRSHTNWVPYRCEGETWFGFDKVKLLTSRHHEILLIPLRGHSEGHSGVAVSTTDGWLLHCGDAYFHRSEVSSGSAELPSMIGMIEAFTEVDNAVRCQNRDRLAALAQDPYNGVRLFCSHDHDEYQACCAHPSVLGRAGVAA
jgi:glyoxylase-like metal-dependent hydrolase (beta-lactamase superfamily II)